MKNLASRIISVLFIAYSGPYVVEENISKLDSLSPMEIEIGEVQIGSISVSHKELEAVGNAIWRNEGSGKDIHLTHWNIGEEFPSFGIGHFIWLPKNYNAPFKESFPKLLHFLQQRGIILPRWTLNTKYAPWSIREEFLSHLNSLEMRELRLILKKSMAEQTLFITYRLEKALPVLLNQVSLEKRELLQKHFDALLSTPAGLYALIDYVNFKGEGVSIAEQYQGHGWGLLQVLLHMEETSSEEIVEEFVRSAKEILRIRVKNSPQSRNELKWLKGWENRVDTYRNFCFKES